SLMDRSGYPPACASCAAAAMLRESAPAMSAAADRMLVLLAVSTGNFAERSAIRLSTPCVKYRGRQQALRLVVVARVAFGHLVEVVIGGVRDECLIAD